MQRDVTVRYSRKRFSGLFPAVAASSHEVHSHTRRVFQKRQQPLVHRLRKFCFHRAIPGIKLSHLVHADSDHGFTLNTYNHVISDRSQDSVVGIATGYVLDNQGVRVRVPVGSRIFSSPHHPDWLWGPRSLLSNGYGGGLFPQG
jgi:hypothetical protein